MTESSTVFMEEHLEAYFLWKRLGVKDAWCWHVDAHLDIGKMGLDLEALATCRSAAEAKSRGLLGNSYLPWGGLHCGNYLYPAIAEGMVSKLTWVIPPDLPEGKLLTWARAHLNSWFELSLGEYASLDLEGDLLKGTLCGIPFEMGLLEHLIMPEEPILLDVDIDYFFSEEGELWGEPSELVRVTSSLETICTTVAYSVKGGFTPQDRRSLGELFGADSSEAYEVRPLDDLAALVRCHRYEEALGFPASETVEDLFLRGTSLQALKRYEEALEVWEGLLACELVPRDGRAYLLGLAADLCLALGQIEKALAHSLEAQRLAPLEYRHVFAEAQAREKLNDDRRAVRALRKTVRLAEDLLFGLQARYVLSRVYKRQGKEGLAKLELQKLAALDVTGSFQPMTML